MSTPALADKPVLRGWLHLGMTPVVILAGALLMALAPTAAGRIGAGIWLLGSVALFGTSALYHRGNWSPATTAMLRRLDHANIFVFIAATYTPLALTLLAPAEATTLLALIWGVAAAGVIFEVWWLSAPRWLDVVCYLLLGWAGIGWLPAFWASGGPAVVLLIAAGGLAYSVGAVFYALKRPNPSPRWFGFHELFHACTIAAALCHLAAITLAVMG